MCGSIQTLLSCLLDSLWGNTGKVMGKFKVPNFSMWILLLRLFFLSLFFSHIAYHSQGEKWVISLCAFNTGNMFCLGGSANILNDSLMYFLGGLMRGSKSITNLKALKERTNPAETIHTYIRIYMGSRAQFLTW